MPRHLLAIGALLAVSACSGGPTSTTGPTDPGGGSPNPTDPPGGGGTPTATRPLSETGFAAANSQIGRGSDFTLQKVVRITGDGEDLAFDEQEIAVSLPLGTTDIEVVIEGETHRLRLVDDGFFQRRIGETLFVVVQKGDRLPFAEIVEVFAAYDNRLNGSNVVIGFDTSPAEVAARGGTATMTGQLFLNARNGVDDGFGYGEGTLTADFDRNRVSGAFDITNLDAGGADFDIPDATIALQTGTIAGNGFSGFITVTSGNLGGTLREARYSGRFFGQDAPAAGGQISATVDVDGTDTPTLIEGAFLVTD